VTRARHPAPCHLRELMSWPFFSLSKNPRLHPIDFTMGDVTVHVAATGAAGIATIWDADVLIWAATRLIAARNRRQPLSRLVRAPWSDILTLTGRGCSGEKYARLRSALDRLAATEITTSLGAGQQPFRWLVAWRRCDGGVELELSAWFHEAAMAHRSALTLDPAYFRLTGGLERWLYLLARRHGGRQKSGWRFDLRHLHHKSGSLMPLPRFAFEIRRIAASQALLGYRLGLGVTAKDAPVLTFEAEQSYPHSLVDNMGRSVDNRPKSVDRTGDKS
jgi:plasmid replication initiation protein